MPIVPLGIGSYKRSDGLTPEVVLRNLYLEEDKSGISPDKTLRIQRPGLTRLHRFGDQPVMGLHYRTATNERLTVQAGQLYSGTNVKGSVPAMSPVAMVSTPFLSLIAADGKLYRYATQVDAIALPNDAPASGFVQDVDQLNAYGLILLPNGRFYWLVPGEITINALNFATAESLPDKAKALRRLGDEFWIFGDENIEVWQPTGDQDAPFQRASGRNFERGCLARDTVRRFDNTLVWVGDDYQVYRASSVPTVISDNGIAERIRKATGPCSAWTFGIDGHSFYVLTTPGQGRFAYDASTQAWSEFTWPAGYGYQVNGAIVAASDGDGRLFSVDANALTDDGTGFERCVSATVAINGKPPRNDSVSVGVGCSQTVSVRFRWCDGQDSYPPYYEEVQALAPYDIAVLWRLGMPDQPYRSIEISCDDPSVRVRFSGCFANEAWS